MPLAFRRAANRNASSPTDPFVIAAGLAALGAVAAAALARPSGSAPRRLAKGVPNRADLAQPKKRGRDVASPVDFPPLGWKEIGLRIFRQITESRVLAVAAGVTFYSLLALFPALVALVSLYGLTADLATLRDHIALFDGVAPAGVLSFVGDQVARIVLKSDGALGFAFLFGLGAALWSANAGAKAMFDALNVVYREREKRSFVILNLTSLAFTLGAVIFVVLAFNAVVVLPLVLDRLWLGPVAEPLLQIGRWPAMLAVILGCLSLLYRFGPSREDAKWRWLTPGALLASLLWLGGSAAFSWYAENLARFDETYGPLGAAIGMMLWMWMSSIVVLLGGELNAEMELQTARDTTTGAPRPMGLRGARVADTVASAE